MEKEENKIFPGFAMHTHSSSPKIDIKRIVLDSNWLNKSGTQLSMKDLFSFGITDSSTARINQNLVSYSFSRDVKNFTGSFELQIKEDYTWKDGGLVLDTVKPWDIVYIHEQNDSHADFIGIVETISFGATAGAYNKVVSISGTSAGKVFNDFKFSTNATNMAFFQTQAANLKWTQEMNTAFEENAKKKVEGVNIPNAMAAFWTMLADYAVDKNYAKISTAGLIRFEQKLYGQKPFSLSPENLSFTCQILNNFFTENEVTFISTFRQLLPDTVYELYDTVSDGVPKVMVREKPFEWSDWSKLECTEIDPSLLIDYTFTRSNHQVYSCFFSMLEGSPMEGDFYLAKESSVNGNNAYAYDEDKMNMYGFSPLTVNFVGYDRSSCVDDPDKVRKTQSEVFKALSNKLKRWFSKLDEMWTGSITLVNIGKSLPKIGNRIKFCGGEFYITSESHSWQYGNSPTVNYQIERGGVYSASGFSPLKADSISTQFAELLKKE